MVYVGVCGIHMCLQRVESRLPLLLINAQVGATPLHLAVLLEDGDRIVDLLLTEGANCDEPKAVR